MELRRCEPYILLRCNWCAEEGCLQAKMLKTSGGFHTKLMQPARDAWQANEQIIFGEDFTVHPRNSRKGW